MGRLWLGAALAFFSLSLRGCSQKPEDLPECNLKELWVDSRKAGGDEATAEYDPRPRMQEECCMAVRAFLTDLNAINPNHSPSAKDVIKQQAAEETTEKLVDINSKDDKEKKAAEVDGKKKEEILESGKAPDDPTATGVEDVKVPNTKDSEVNKDIQESHKAELQVKFDNSFCNMGCQIVGSGPDVVQIRHDVEKMCNEQSSIGGVGQKEGDKKGKTKKDVGKEAMSSFLEEFLPEGVQNGIAELAKGAADDGVEVTATAEIAPAEGIARLHPRDALQDVEVAAEGAASVAAGYLATPRRVMP